MHACVFLIQNIYTGFTIDLYEYTILHFLWDNAWHALMISVGFLIAYEGTSAYQW